MALRWCGLLFLFFSSCINDQEYLFEQVESPDGAYEVFVEYRDPPIYGPHTICFFATVKLANEKRKLECRELHNDGKILTEANIQLQWLSNTQAQVILQGEEQVADTLLLDVSL